MPGFLIKNLPAELHRRLKESAAKHHRSMTREALALLEQALAGPSRNAAATLERVEWIRLGEEALAGPSRNAAATLPEPLKPLRPIPPDAVVSWIREGRERRETILSGKPHTEKAP
jgi:plasmid stability protein